MSKFMIDPRNKTVDRLHDDGHYLTDPALTMGIHPLANPYFIKDSTTGAYYTWSETYKDYVETEEPVVIAEDADTDGQPG